MTGKLTGTIIGTDHADLIKQATAKASTYFLMSTFLADFTAQVWHRLGGRPYGPDRCLNCGLDSWPQNPLPGS
jgi:hypothetical protein